MQKFVGESIRRRRAVDHPPVDAHALMAGSRPFHIGDGDPPMFARGHGPDDRLVSERLDEALALQFGLVLFNAAGDIDR